jgi:DNA-binding NarL/FixJ family response regulator
VIASIHTGAAFLQPVCMARGHQTCAAVRKLLIVDDHAAFRRTLRAFLPPGEVIECADGRDALACYEAERPDWVLMDIEMPGVDGLTATRELKQRFPAARVIIVTHHCEDELRMAALDAGACEFLLKDQLADLGSLIEASDHRERIS